MCFYVNICVFFAFVLVKILLSIAIRKASSQTNKRCEIKFKTNEFQFYRNQTNNKMRCKVSKKIERERDREKKVREHSKTCMNVFVYRYIYGCVFFSLFLFKCLPYRLVVELTLVLLRERRDIIESPQLTTVPLLIENVRRRYKSSLCRGLYGRSGNEHTRGR